MAKTVRKGSTDLFPVPTVMVTCADADGKPNIITLAWVGTVCSEPPHLTIAIRPSRHSHSVVKDAGEFVVNIPSEKLLEQTDLCGTVSGRDVDKFQEAGFTAAPATQVKVPLIAECPVNIECRVKEVLSLGTHDVFVAEVLATHVDDDCLTDKGRIDVDKVRPIAYAQHEYWSLGERIGTYGFSQKK